MRVPFRSREQRRGKHSEGSGSDFEADEAHEADEAGTHLNGERDLERSSDLQTCPVVMSRESEFGDDLTTAREEAAIGDETAHGDQIAHRDEIADRDQEELQEVGSAEVATRAASGKNLHVSTEFSDNGGRWRPLRRARIVLRFGQDG